MQRKVGQQPEEEAVVTSKAEPQAESNFAYGYGCVGPLVALAITGLMGTVAHQLSGMAWLTEYEPWPMRSAVLLSLIVGMFIGHRVDQKRARK